MRQALASTCNHFPTRTSNLRSERPPISLTRARCMQVHVQATAEKLANVTVFSCFFTAVAGGVWPTYFQGDLFSLILTYFLIKLLDENLTVAPIWSCLKRSETLLG
ncbi:hypothetical protein BKA82DRAFT_380587 [Pisolithus tinctorius]|uniref:Uncharacterized protein n=1 Tax=Pisolithus tinctorius Marx 270 TaxID=870435 RepID=A0A0C3NPF3_PISTI|nr:hypothetical protein BKA82DRAFT_380587 [Pisolithus tinctorius]KIN94520.1 hypothetical protein M404DRAFT_380587 [Pisolithus tinctorius Marx 270]KIN97450.1 hypothetical protein M404DRAFT_895046 [Pisolithus tinctorius Marx 270]